MQFESRTLKTALAEPSIIPTVVSWFLAGIGMILALRLHLLSALLPGLLVYVLVRLLAPRIQKRFAGRTARLIALVALATVTMVFLVIIHKLEYFLNARIVGSRINARAWELLLAMIVLEAAFGIAGLIAAPIYYAYIKNELSAARLI